MTISSYLSNKLGSDKCCGRKNFKNRLIEREKDYCWGEGGRIDIYTACPGL